MAVGDGGNDIIYTLDPRLLIYPRKVGHERVFAAEVDCALPPLILRHPSIAHALMLLPERFSKPDALKAWAALNFVGLPTTAIWDALVEAGLVRRTEEVTAALPMARTWRRFGWAEALAYHAAVRDYPFIRMDEADAFERDESRMRDYIAASAPPDIYQEFSAVGTVPLAKIDPVTGASATFHALSVEGRRGLPGLSFLFDLCFGERAQKPFSVQGSFLRKSIPSGGARHPTEIFFVAFANAPIPLGVYHYNVRAHRLDRMRDGNFKDACADATFDLFKKFDNEPLGLLVFTSLYERAMWRYRDARSWRAVLIDIGHALMIFRTVSRALGFRHYTYQKFKDDAVAGLLGLHSVRQTPLFVGTLV